MTEIKVLKRNGKTTNFDITKIENAILYAMNDVDYKDKESIFDIIESIQEQIEDVEEETKPSRYTEDDLTEILKAIYEE